MSSGAVPPTHTRCLPRRSRGARAPQPYMHLPLLGPVLPCLFPLLPRPLWLPQQRHPPLPPLRRQSQRAKGRQRRKERKQRGSAGDWDADRCVSGCLDLYLTASGKNSFPRPKALLAPSHSLLLSNLQWLARVQGAGRCADGSRTSHLTWD